MPIITLTTDFGIRNPDLGYLKGLILQALPQSQLIDISHNALPFDTDEAVYIIKNALSEFPNGTIHFIGLDSESYPGQKPILISNGKHFFLGNDNGIIPAALQGQNFQVYQIPFEKPQEFMQAHIQVAKQLSKGIMPQDFLSLFKDYKEIKLSKPMLRYDDKSSQVKLISPKVIYVDNYGNAVFNLTRTAFDKWRNKRKFVIKTGHNEIDKIVDYYNDVDDNQIVTAAGKMFARFNHYGYFEIFIYKSNHITGGADTLLGLRKNQLINIVFETS
jgi:S-adenosylmethionine hydrolase